MVTGSPRQMIWPESGCNSPYTIFTKVDFPAPFSPRSAWISPASISKPTSSFAAANDDVGFEIEAGEIHALLGENGAGKSTFVKMVYGLLQPDSGQIIWRGEPVTIRSPQHARELGIGMVFQHFSLFQALTVAAATVSA